VLARGTLLNVFLDISSPPRPVESSNNASKSGFNAEMTSCGRFMQFLEDSVFEIVGSGKKHLLAKEK